MRWGRATAVTLRHFYLLRGSPSRVLPLFAWVVVDMVLWGFITQYLNSVAGARFDFVPVLLGAVLLWDFFIRVMQGVTMAFLEDVWSRNFLNVFATPITVAEYVSGLVLSSVVTSAVGLAAMIACATAAFALSLLGYGPLLAPALLILLLFGIALGILAAALVLRFGPASEWFVWPIPALLSPFVGVFYPLSTLPAWMRAVGRLLPPSYVFDAARSVVSGGPVSAAGLLAGGALAAGYVLVAGWVFARVFRYAVRTGLIARYSAETVA